MACIIENDVLMYGLMDELNKCDNVLIKNQVKIDTVELANDQCQFGTVSLQSGEQFCCDLLVSIEIKKNKILLTNKIILFLFQSHFHNCNFGRNVR